jgi:hypothetical protein
MERKSYPQSEKNLPGTWHNTKTYGNVFFTCPKCGRTGILDHEILPNGDVNPSVVCPTEGCDFHEYVNLAGW